MSEPTWQTHIAIACDNPALRRNWQRVEQALYGIMARCGWDTRICDYKLREVADVLENVQLHTIDMRLAPSRRFKSRA